MKNIVLAAVCLVSSTGMFAQQNAIGQYFSDYEKQEEFTKVHVTSKMFELALHIEGNNAEEQELLDAISKVEGLTVLANESTEKAASFFAEASKRPGGEFEELMTVDDKDAEVVFLIKENKGIISEMLVIAGTDKEFAVVDIWGEIDLKQVRKMTDAFSVMGMDHFDDKMAEASMHVNYYPNPIGEGKNGTLTVPDELLGGTLQIRDTRGTLIYEGQVNQLTTTIPLSNQPSGTYVLTLAKGNAKLYTEKIVIAR